MLASPPDRLPPKIGKLGRKTVSQGGSYSTASLADDEHKELSDSLSGIVQVFLQGVEPNFSQPWTKSMPTGATGTGFVVDVRLRLVVTNAHCVEFARTIQLRKNGDHDQFEAKLLTISHQVDIAVLTVDDEKFWHGAVAIPFGELCRMQQTVNVIGYPIGGETISITRGVVSRIDWIGYAQSGGEGQLCVQVDAAINPGNSGGPALSEGRLVGIAFQGMDGEEASNVGYIIPVTIVKELLKEFKESAGKMGINLEHEHHVQWPATKKVNVPLVNIRPFARFEAIYQEAESIYLRMAVQLPETLSGVVIRSVPVVSNLNGVLQNNDVLVAIDGISIGNEGRVLCPPLQPLDFQYLISSKLVGDPLHLTICRGGVLQEIETTAENNPRRIPLISKEPAVSYVMFAGFVFSPLANDSAIADNEIEDFIVKKEAELLLASKKRSYTEAGQQCVVLSSVLPHSVSLGYQKIAPFVPLYKINGHDVFNIVDVARQIAAAKDPLITFEMCDDTVIVLPVQEGLVATAEIQEDFGMPNVLSKDVIQALGMTEKMLNAVVKKTKKMHVMHGGTETSTEKDDDWEDVEDSSPAADGTSKST